MAAWRRSGLVWVFFAVVTIAGCDTAGTGKESTSTAPDTTNATSAPASTGSACADVAAQGQVLGAVVLQFVDGTATANQVRSAADDLSNALTSAGGNAKANMAAALDDAQTALGQLLTALQAQPVDRDGVRTASTDVLNALGNVAAVCEPAPTS